MAFDKQQFEANLGKFYDTVDEMGGNVEAFLIADPLGMDVVEDLEAKLGKKVPEDLATFITEKSGQIEYWWDVDDLLEDEEIEFPEELEELYCGQINFNPNQLLSLNLEFNQIAEERIEALGENEAFLKDFFVVAYLENGMGEEVEYLGDYVCIHTAEETKGKISLIRIIPKGVMCMDLAQDFEDYLMRMSKIGFAETVLAFWKSGIGLDADGELAEEFREIMGVE